MSIYCADHSAFAQGEPQPIEVALIDTGNYTAGTYNTTFRVQLEATLQGSERMIVGPVSEAQVTIINTNARTGTIRMGQSKIIVGELHGIILLNVTRTGGADCAATVLYRTVAIPGSDFGHYGTNHLSQQGQVVWLEGDDATKTISLPIIDNKEIQEGGEAFYVEIYDAGCASLDVSAARAKVEVTDDERIGILVVEKKELVVSSLDDVVEVAVRRVGGSARPVSLDFDLAPGTALAERDYGDISGRMIWKSGEFGLRYVRIPILNDNSSSSTELQRSFLVRLLYVVGTTVDADQVDVTILNANAQPGKVGFVSMSQCRAPLPSTSNFCLIYTEGETARLEVTRTGGYAGAISVLYTIKNLTSTGRDNVGSITGSLSWKDLDSIPKYIEVPLLFDDDYRQKLEYLSIVLSDEEALLPSVDMQRSQAFVTVLDQDGAGSLIIEAGQTLFRETSGFVQLLVQRQCRGLCAGGRVSVDFETLDGDAIRDVDFVAKRGRLTWEEGDVSNRTVSVELINDATSSYTKHFKHMFVRLLNSSQNVLLDPRATIAALYIIDDNAVTGFPTFAPSYFSSRDQKVHGEPVVRDVLEGSDQKVELTVTRLGGNQGNMSVRYRTLGVTAEEDLHFVATSGVLTWAEADVSNRTISIDILDDSYFSPFTPERRFRVVLEHVTFSNGILASQIYKGPRSTYAEVVIEEDEGWGLLSLEETEVYVDEWVGMINLTVHRRMGSSGDISVMVGDMSGSATRRRPGSRFPKACAQSEPSIDVIEAAPGQAREVYCNGGFHDDMHSASIFRWDYSTRLWDRQCIEVGDSQAPLRNKIARSQDSAEILMSEFSKKVSDRYDAIREQPSVFDYAMSSFITTAANYSVDCNCPPTRQWVESVGSFSSQATLTNTWVLSGIAPFAVHWVSQTGDILFVFNPRPAENAIVMNSKVDGAWGTEERVSYRSFANTNTWTVMVDSAGFHVQEYVPIYFELVGEGYCRPPGYQSDNTLRVNGRMSETAVTSDAHCAAECLSLECCIGYAYDIDARAWCYLYGTGLELGDMPFGWEAYSTDITQIEGSSGANGIVCKKRVGPLAGSSSCLPCTLVPGETCASSAIGGGDTSICEEVWGTPDTVCNSDSNCVTPADCEYNGASRVSSTEGALPRCKDDATWTDSYEDDCDWYGIDDCATAADYSNLDGEDASEKCCVCGGGSQDWDMHVFQHRTNWSSFARLQNETGEPIQAPTSVKRQGYWSTDELLGAADAYPAFNGGSWSGSSFSRHLPSSSEFGSSGGNGVSYSDLSDQGTVEYVELYFAESAVVKAVEIYERAAIDRLVQVQLLDPGGSWDTVWQGLTGDASEALPVDPYRFSEFFFEVTEFRDNARSWYCAQFAEIRVFDQDGNVLEPLSVSGMPNAYWSDASGSGSGSGSGTETPDNLFDGSVDTKYCDQSRQGSVYFSFRWPVWIASYELVTADGDSSADAISWSLKGRQDSSSEWTILHEMRQHEVTTSRNAVVGPFTRDVLRIFSPKIEARTYHTRAVRLNIDSGCHDMLGLASGDTWFDGTDYCEAYDDNPTWCDVYGSIDFNGEGSASDKCCICGGGSWSTNGTGSSAPTYAIDAVALVSASNPKCCDLSGGQAAWQPVPLPMQQSLLLMGWQQKQVAWCSMNCLDDASFIDSMGKRCEEWLGYDCFSSYGLYSHTELLEVQKSCPSMCRLCAANMTGMFLRYGIEAHTSLAV